MANLRLIQLKAVDSRTIKCSWTDRLDPQIGTGNVTVTSLIPGVPDSQVLQVKVKDQFLTITTLPLTPNCAYLVTFKSTNTIKFKSLNGTAFLLEDNRTNVKQIQGPEDPINIIRDNLIIYLRDGPYDLSKGTFVRSVIDQVAGNLLRSKYDIYQTRNDNYLSFLVTDEKKVRGKGPFDRLGEENAYEVIRVGRTATNAQLGGAFSFDSFPSDPITLLRTDVTNEELGPGSGPGTFDSFTLTLEHGPVTILNSVSIHYADGYVFNYSISSFGYQIKNPRYDTSFASTLLTLSDNQVKLNESILDSSDFRIPGGGDKIIVSYQYKSLGRFIDEGSVLVSQVLNSIREATPALATEFSLGHAPIVTASDNIATLNGVQFLDPSSETPFLTIHPAFLVEIPFRFESLPRNPGEFSIDYSTGKVFVFGATSENDGTGDFPPAATYKYRKSFVNNLDYTYDPSTNDLAASPLRDLATQTAKISFNYEETLIPGVDFNSDIHQESVDERIQNRIKTLNSVSVLNAPITNAFRVFNETSGETYRITRFNDNTIFYTFNTAPSVLEATRERSSFTNVLNETLIVNSETVNTGSVRVLEILLNNNRIMSATEDLIGASYNTSASFSRADIFQTELFYDGQILDVDTNINRLAAGEYQIDYRNGIVYVGVTSTQNFDIGTISYKNSIISPENPHVIAVSDIFYSLSQILLPVKHFNYSSFDDGAINPTSFDVSDERFLNGDHTQPYAIISDKITVTNDIKAIRHIYDAFDLNNHAAPTDFGTAATFSANIITLDDTGVEKREVLTVGSGLTVTVSFISPGIELGTAVSVVRLSDGAELLDGYETISGNTITLSASSGAVAGDQVDVIYTVVLTSSATPIVDYDHGGYYVSYTYLADEILVSYEYGDNVIDWRESNTIVEGDTYFVTYRVGALRDALLQNFGTLVDLPTVTSFDINLPRENYRDALIGALQSFTKGPTIPAIETLVSSVTKITPQIIESIFTVWSLGISRLFTNEIKVNGDPQLVAGKFDRGILPLAAGDSVQFPVSSNLRLEEGTLQFWAIPDWSGLDNDATLTFSHVLRDGYTLSSNNIFIGSGSYHPSFNDSNEFSINRLDDPSPLGVPAAIYTQPYGLFIYYNPDVKRWNVLVKDHVIDGYDGYVYSGTILSSGEVYDAKFIPDLGEVDDILRSGQNKIDFTFHINAYDNASPDGYVTGDGYMPPYSFDGISFMADDQHYLFDFAEDIDKNRFSIYKDGRGYLNFEVWDRGGRIPNKRTRRNSYTVSTDIQNWKAGEKHNIAASWKLNTIDKRDEIHLYIDGFEVPNIIRYGGRPTGTSSDRFRIVKPEIVAGVVPLNAIAGNDLQTNQGSNIVFSPSNDFTAQGVTIGNTILINESGFGTYTITSVSNNFLTLSSNMPATLTDARFSVNPYSVIVSSEIDLFANIAVSVLRGGIETEIPGVRAEIPGYEISKNAFNQNVLTILGDALAGDTILIRTLGLNHRRARDRVYLWGNDQAVLRTDLPPPINLDEVTIKPVLLPLLPIGPNNSTIILGNFVAAGISTSQPINSTEGRILEVRITGGNVNFTSPTTVTINGTTAAGPLFETLSFSAAGIQQTVNKFKTISSVDVTTTPFSTSKAGTAIEIKEAYSVTTPNGNSIYPVIRFAYQTQMGITLEGTGTDVVSDSNGFFALSDVGNLMVISSPGSVAGTYQITERIDNNTVRLSPTPPTSFTGGRYNIYNVSIGRSGFQNGFFFLERAGLTNVAFPLPQGYYEFDYSAYLEIPFDPITQQAYVGNDFTQQKPAKAVIDELRILSRQLTDTRVGETLAINQESITTGYTALKAFRKNIDTLMLLHFDVLPLVNDSDYYIFANRSFVQSGASVNGNFGHSIVFRNKGLEFDNKGRLTTNSSLSEGTIEFWVSPMFDTYNDPNIRVYFDAASSVVESLTSLTKGTVKVSGRIGQVLSVRLVTDTDNTGVNYFAGGSIADDRKTINTGTALPFQNTPVKVAYIPSGLDGDRLSIYKDTEGFITFNIRASGQDYQVRQPVFWTRNSWHRVRATFKFNRLDNKDEIRLFIDGEERGVILFGSGLLFGDGTIFGQTTVGVTNQILVADINFTDPVMQFFIGQDFTGAHGAFARIDNFKLSDIAKTPVTVSGQPIDVNWNSNLDMVFPVIEDAFTTFLLNFEQLVEKTDNFSELRDAEFGIFNFTLNIIDSFGIVTSSDRIKQLLESMILALKPATSKVQINYVK